MSTIKTVEERLAAIEANTAILIEIMRAIATELGIREQVRGLMRRVDGNGHDSAPPGAEGETP